MSIQARISDFLRDNRSVDFCDDCIAQRLPLKKRQQSQSVTSALAETTEFTRTTGRCSSCGKIKTVIRAT